MPFKFICHFTVLTVTLSVIAPDTFSWISSRYLKCSPAYRYFYMAFVEIKLSCFNGTWKILDSLCSYIAYTVQLQNDIELFILFLRSEKF